MCIKTVIPNLFGLMYGSLALPELSPQREVL